MKSHNLLLDLISYNITYHYYSNWFLLLVVAKLAFTLLVFFVLFYRWHTKSFGAHFREVLKNDVFKRVRTIEAGAH